MTTVAGSITRPSFGAPASSPDRLGIVASTLCAVHCAGTALLAGVSGVGALFADERLEVGFCVCALSLALTALVRGSRRHRSWMPGCVGSPGVVLLLTARLARLESSVMETILSVAGGLLLISAHVLNIRRLSQVGSCCEVCDDV
jgi:MerC mercury resistance protein